MLNALSQIRLQQINFWVEYKLQNDEILVREIIDIDTNYMEDDENTSNNKAKNDENENNKSDR